ncbi:MAG: hypothetical protein DRP57_11070 [Spirochaetes bacterium]|nr:MAG: hypothetical protein DRP57_11070 [Spirochaetota bacterium]
MEYLKPLKLKELFTMLKSSGKYGSESAGRGKYIRYIAGGTDLAVQIRDSGIKPSTLIDLSAIDELKGLSLKDGTIRIGSAVTIAEIAESKEIPACLKVGALSIGSPQIRNLATIGGNICNASPCGDTLTPLLVLKAEFELASDSGNRLVRAEDFFTGPKKTVLKENEVLKAVHIDKNNCTGVSFFKKIGKRNAQIISQVNVSVYMELNKDKKIVKIRAAAGSVAPVPLRLKGLEEALKGAEVKDFGLEDIYGFVNSDIKPISDVRASSDYRRRVTASLIYDILEEAANVN